MSALSDDETVVDARGARRRQTRCGTVSGAARHAKLGEKACDACAAAKAAYDAEWRAQPENVIRSRLYARAQQAAERHLVHKYKAEYDEVYRAERARLLAEHGLAAR